MKIERLKENLDPLDFSNPNVSVKYTGNITEIRTQNKKCDSPITKLDADNYVLKQTGEIKSFKHDSTSRLDNKNSVAQSLKMLRDIINCNVTIPQNCKWLTLTYKDNMQDTVKLYNDFRKWVMRLKSFLTKNKLPSCEYIAAFEPQSRGAWHAHVILIFSQKAPFISNADLANIWGHGFVKIKDLNNVDNVGLYLTAYLGDMSLDEISDFRSIKQNSLKAVLVDTPNGKQKKAVIKGARLNMYPINFKIYRHSKGVIMPTVQKFLKYDEAKSTVQGSLKFERTIKLMDDNGGLVNIINYQQYNNTHDSLK